MQQETTSAMNDEKQIQSKKKDGAVNLGRHQAQCTICQSPYRQQIEEDWMNWHSPAYFEKVYGLSRDCLYRHAHAFDLFPERHKNISMALDKIVERVDWTTASGSVILAAIKLLMKNNEAGKGDKAVQGADSQKVAPPMSPEERQDPVQDGSLPESPSTANGTTPCQGQEAETASPVTEAQTLQ